jgi:hypothetical protein
LPFVADQLPIFDLYAVRSDCLAATLFSACSI